MSHLQKVLSADKKSALEAIAEMQQQGQLDLAGLLDIHEGAYDLDVRTHAYELIAAAGRSAHNRDEFRDTVTTAAIRLGRFKRFSECYRLHDILASVQQLQEQS